MANNKAVLVYKPKEVSDWFPVTPPAGPPLPKFLEIYWPWYMEGPPVEPPPEPPPLPGLAVIYSKLIVPAEVVPVGKETLIKFDLTNPNYHQVSQPVILSGSFQSSWQVNVPANSTITESFTVKPMEPGVFLIKIDGLQAPLSADVLYPEVISLTAIPAVVIQGNNVAITAMVENKNYYATVPYQIVLSGAIQAQKTGTLLPHEVLGVVFTETVDWLGLGAIFCEDKVVEVRGELLPGPYPKYICEFCGAEFIDETALMEHITEVHEETPDQSGIFEISSGVYETRWPDGTVISTTYVTNTAVTIDDGGWGETQVFPSGTKSYDVLAAYFAAKVDGENWSQGEWSKYINMYYYVRKDDVDWSDWDESSMSTRRTAYYWFADLIPRYCPLTWNP